ncbi:aminotransferase class V-fold PLP-dependent enzyme [Mycoplasma putrefaciens]|uniref:cysteine desulfurase n=1 Tax=Mycoplasma putrefaciens (strain ATCC 15718 / NCTC 10155 / C30 KS-1 / KS-1) TaxID=743965 RepID=A0A7U4E9G8_MYCPK|nr:aminotransferase class V-fold PLP-dependent enzyme [Mycoplasma putrefaciens]AEM68650.1 aminotransferase class-V family protein [Mycoplasma putrefaciens KS1]
MDKFINIREQFPVLKNNPKMIYFDNGATTLKHQSVIQAELDFLNYISANPHSSDYQTGFQAVEILNQTRSLTREFINAKKDQEIIFTSGATHALNQIAKGLAHLIQPDDEILITSLEHSANLLPWIEVANKTKAVVKPLFLTDHFSIDLDKLELLINSKTRVVSFAHISNTTGYVNDVKKIVQKIRSLNSNTIIVVDAAQSAAHAKIDVQDWDVDFIAIAAHKMYGPFGIGVLYGKYHLLDQLEPLLSGGGMSLEIEHDLINYQLAELPRRLEAGTPNISAIAAFKKTLEFLNDLGIENIASYEHYLKSYLIKQIKSNDLEKYVTFYNINNQSPLLIFNVKNINPQDIAHFLDSKYNIATRAGAHCARRLVDVIDTKLTVRVTFAVYNTTTEIDQLISALKNADKFLDALF